MASVEMLMPKMGESIIEGTILTWLKKEGDSIEQDESVLEVATDKVDTEVPATHGGILKKIRFLTLIGIFFGIFQFILTEFLSHHFFIPIGIRSQHRLFQFLLWNKFPTKI